ncbi:hypothetical protein K435DRAFT_188550 [Dendrothele bispora CBS 962.96]|uniref:ABC-2 type transporter transmembrane domain-containing protein n=1 Tax=Dendrothele bispora (strain CBS 962.96) TaxID=1314807 RepID=A0A4S8LW02_DENBC|nr:hypothetical protein K435DRAFT_188550 [Dendrothele bispora CBS 962.96]
MCSLTCSRLLCSRLTGAYFSRGGVFYFALLFSAPTIMAEIPSPFDQQPIFLRHMQRALYHPFVDQAAFSWWISRFCSLRLVSFVIIYTLVQLQQTAGQVFVFLLFIFSVALAYESLAATCMNESVARTLLVSSSWRPLCMGYMILRPSMIP